MRSRSGPSPTPANARTLPTRPWEGPRPGTSDRPQTSTTTGSPSPHRPTWIIRGSGDLHTKAELQNGSRTMVTSNDDGLPPPDRYQFQIRRTLGAGTDYLKVEGYDENETCPYPVQATAAGNPGTQPQPHRPPPWAWPRVATYRRPRTRTTSVSRSRRTPTLASGPSTTASH